MTEAVKGKSELRRRRTVDIEERIIEAATRLFVADGYGATTLSAVAAEAGVADRTVYVRFGRKAVLFKRVVDVAIVGDTEAVDVRGRDWFARARTAPSLEERVEAMTVGSTELMGRFGPLLAATREAEAAEPELAEAAQAGRDYTLGTVRMLWEAAAADGLLDPGVDLDWLVATTGLLVGSDTYYSVQRMLAWDVEAYRTWLSRTLWQLATTPSPAGPALPE